MKNSYPRWLYKPIDIPNLIEIQQELIPILYKEIPEFEDTTYAYFKMINREIIRESAPSFVKFLESLGFLDRWNESAFSTTNLDFKLPIHIDHVDWAKRCYSLNIPLVNCEGSYTVFYDAEVVGAESFSTYPYQKSRLVNSEATPKEIGRCDANIPAWINVRIPHTGVTTHNKPRAVFSTRFAPELHKWLYK